MEIQGKVILDLGTQSGTSKAGNLWQKKEVIIETFGAYPKRVKLTIFGEQRMQNTPCEVGSSYTFSIDIESREYMGRWYTDVNAFSSRPYVETGNAPVPDAPYVNPAPAAQPQPFAPAADAPAAPSDPFASNESDDLPF